jgi:hypothetical protein
MFHRDGIATTTALRTKAPQNSFESWGTSFEQPSLKSASIDSTFQLAPWEMALMATTPPHRRLRQSKAELGASCHDGKDM